MYLFWYVCPEIGQLGPFKDFAVINQRFTGMQTDEQRTRAQVNRTISTVD